MPDTSTTAPATETISGTVTDLYRATPLWSAGRLRSKGRDISFKVKGFVKIGEPVTIRGTWTNHSKYGRQFDGAEVVYTLPADPAGLALWLSWYLPSIGPVKGQRLIDEFGMDLVRLASEDPQQVAACGGVPIESINRLAEEWAKYSSKISAASELASFGLTQHQVEVLFARFKGSAVTLLREDPYLLIREVEGFGFKTVDEIARKLGYPEDHPGRRRAAVITAVAEARDEGSTAVPLGVAVADACDLLSIPEEQHAAALESLAHDAADLGQISRVSTGDGRSVVGVPNSYRHECLAWETLSRAGEPNPWIAAPEQVAAMYSSIRNKELDPTQRAAVLAAASNRMSFITGGAGAGKTLVASAIHKMFTDDDVKVMLCAPTGKAARRMQDVIGAPAQTIHRLLGYLPTGQFDHTDRNPLPPGVVVCDELSMVDSELAYYLFRALGPKTAFVGIGDPNQLPPVGAGALLRDVIAHGLATVVRLEKCHRQAGPLKANCAAILDGRVEPTVDGENGNPSPWMVHDGLATPERILAGVKTLFEKYLPSWGYDPVADTQFLTAKHAGPCGTIYLNRVCQRLRQKQLGVDLPEPDLEELGRTVLYAGDKVIQTRNNYQINVMNGTQGVVVEPGPSLVVRYDERDVVYPSEFKSEVQLAYVLTPHKAQGSEWPCAVVIVPKQHGFMQHKNWTYTAVTRAQKTCVVIGEREAIRRAAERVEADKRTTWLETFSRHEEARP